MDLFYVFFFSYSVEANESKFDIPSNISDSDRFVPLNIWNSNIHT